MIARQIGWTISLAATMTGIAVWSFVFGSWLWEFAPPRGTDDDWLWLLLPAGAAIAGGLWVRYRRHAWIHFFGPVSVAALAASIAWALAQETPEGMEGLGVAIGKALALALAVVAACVGTGSLVLAAAIVAVVTWRES